MFCFSLIDTCKVPRSEGENLIASAAPKGNRYEPRYLNRTRPRTAQLRTLVHPWYWYSDSSELELPKHMGRTPLRARRLMSLSPRAKAPDFAKPTSRLTFWRHLPQHEGRHSFSDGGLGYSVRPLRGHRKMSKLQRALPATPLLTAKEPPSSVPAKHLVAAGRYAELNVSFEINFRCPSMAPSQGCPTFLPSAPNRPTSRPASFA